MNDPNAFLGNTYSVHRPGPTPAQEPVVGIERPVLSRVVPTVTIYTDRLINLNTEASAIFGGGVCLYPPPAVRAGRTAQPWQIGAGQCNALIPVSRDKPAGSMRFRADEGACPAPGRYTLAALVGHQTRFLLVPV